MVSTEEVWSRLSRQLLVFFRRRVPDEHAAEDLLQESFLRVHDKLASLCEETGAAAYRCDVADPDDVEALFAAVNAASGFPDVGADPV